MANDIFWSAIYLGNFADADSDESDLNMEGINTFLGTHGTASDPLAKQVTELETDTPSSLVERDNTGPNGTVTYDVGTGTTTSRLDGHVLYQATITYMDGTTASTQVDLIQMQNGDVFFVAHDAETNLGTKGIESISLDSYASNADLYPSLTQNAFDTVVFVCFAEGTMIRAAEGELPVEEIRKGTLVETLDHGLQPVVWKGSRTLRFPQSPSSQKPILVKKGALAPGYPENDLVISPQHRVLLATPDGERWAPAKSLTVLKGVRQMNGRRRVTYHTLMCKNHEIIFANDVAVESFYPGEQAMKMLNPVQRLAVIAAIPTCSGLLQETYGGLARPPLSSRQAQTLLQKSGGSAVRSCPFDGSLARSG